MPTPESLGGRFRRAVTPTRLLARGASAAAIARVRALRGDSVGDIAADPRLIAVAEDIAQSLGEMKGAAMKIGQALSFIDLTVVPEEYRRALEMLQAEAPPMPMELVERVVTEELGAPPSEVFTWFSPSPIAAASIGQVHMAHVGDREVVVKVQYPGVAKAIEADLRNAVLLSNIARVAQKMLAGLVGDIDVRALIDEVRDRVSEELDYRIEARNQRRLAELFRDDPDIHIPDVVEDLSTRRVLTTDYVDAMRWSAALRDTQERRDKWGEVIARFVHLSTLHHGVVNVDTHPGNYLFHEDGRITFLDFGCVVYLTPDELTRARQLVVGLFSDDDEKLLDALVASGFLKDRTGFPPAVVLEPIKRSVRAIHASQPYRYSREQLAEILAESMQLRIGADELRALRKVDCPKEYVLLGRATLGLEAVLAHLEASVDYDRVFRDVVLNEGMPAPPHDTR